MTRATGILLATIPLFVGVAPRAVRAADDGSGTCVAPSTSSDRLPELLTTLDEAGTALAPGYSRYRFQLSAEVGSVFIRQQAEIRGVFDLEDAPSTYQDRSIRNLRLEIVLAPDSTFDLHRYSLTPMRPGEASDVDAYSRWSEPSRGYMTTLRDGIELVTESKVQLGEDARGTVLDDGVGSRADGSTYTMTHRLDLAIYCSADLTGCKLGAFTPGIYFLGNGSPTSPDVKVRSEARFSLERVD